MPKKIEATSDDAQLLVERKRLRKYVKQLRQDFLDMPDVQKWKLIKRVLIALLRIEMTRIPRKD